MAAHMDSPLPAIKNEIKRRKEDLTKALFFKTEHIWHALFFWLLAWTFYVLSSMVPPLISFIYGFAFIQMLLGSFNFFSASSDANKDAKEAQQMIVFLKDKQTDEEKENNR